MLKYLTDLEKLKIFCISDLKIRNNDTDSDYYDKDDKIDIMHYIKCPDKLKEI